MHIYKLSSINWTRPSVKLLAGLFIFLFLITLPIGTLAEEGDGKRTEELKAELNAQIDELTGEIEKYRESVAEIKSRSNTLANEISLLDNQIKEFELEIKQLNLILQKVGAEITEIETKVSDIEKQTETEKQALAELVREIYKRDDTSFLEMILTTEKFSDFFSEVQAIEMLQFGLQESLEEIRELKKQLEAEKIILEGQKGEMLALRAVQETQKYSIENKKSERNKILQESKGQEYLYQKLVSSKQADISKIRSQLYVLQGKGGAISFENALTVAEFAAAATGIRPAFVMAILSRESGLGKNVGTGTWRVDMKPSHHSAFLDICQRLGLDPDQMPVSKKAWYGWGGAMGPAQFIPRTWVGYEKRVTAITGHNPPSPWNTEDAFVASALYLANAGATGKTYATEWKAAMIYLAGSNWNKPYLRFYGDQVMDLVGTIQAQIDILRQ